MNSPKIFSKKDFLTFKDDFLYLVEFLKKTGVKNVKVGNIQICSLLKEYAPNEFNLHASTAFEYQNISQYRHLFDNFSNFNLIDLAIHENQNFMFLKSLRKEFPNIKLEVMVNEACIKGCPARIAHIGCDTDFEYRCDKIIEKRGFFNYLFKTGVVYPWNIEYYSAIGINNFKFATNRRDRANYKFDKLKTYLSYIENDTAKVDLSELLLANFNNDFRELFSVKMNVPERKFVLKLTEMKKYFPDINYFVKNGHDCSDKCGVDCFYCDECAKKLEKLIYS